MTHMKILLERSLAQSADAYLQGHDITAVDTGALTRESFAEAIREADAFGFRWQLPFEIDRAALSAAPRLAYIHKSGAGLEHDRVIDLQALDDLGILIGNNVGVNAEAVAEHAVMLTLMALRTPSLAQMIAAREGRWDSAQPEGVPRARTLGGKTVGILGMGRIGIATAQRLKAMGVARILGYRRSPFSEAARAVAQQVSLDEVLAEAEILILALPISDSTRGLLGAGRFAQLRPGVTLVNVGRGAVIDEAALLAALQGGAVRAAGLDVLAEEPSQSPLMRLPNVILTPHTAATAVEVQEAQISAALAALADFTAGRMPPRLMTPSTLASPALRAAWLAPRQGETV